MGGVNTYLSFKYLRLYLPIPNALFPIPVSFLLITSSFFLNPKAYSQLSFSGFGRTIIQKQELSGDILKNDSLSDHISTKGYALFDLRTNYRLGDWLKFSADTRLKNRFGGFGGVGLSLQIRQIRLEGLASKYVKYAIGDVDLKLSPFTLWNYADQLSQAESEIFKFRRNIVEYENFNIENHWRLRGAKVLSVINLKGEERQLTLQAFSLFNRSATSWKFGTNSKNGASIGLNLHKHIELKGNALQLKENSDLNSGYNIQVYSGEWNFMLPIQSWYLGTNGEFGYSNSARVENQNSNAESDYFVQSKIQIKQSKIGLSISGGFQEVGPHYRNPGVQTLRISGDVQTDIFPSVFNNSVSRQANLFDRLGVETIQNKDLQAYRTAYLPQYSLVSPYGDATPNRIGYFLQGSFLPENKLGSLEMKIQEFNEIKGEGIFNKRNFNSLQINGLLNVGQLIAFKKRFEINAAFRHETSNRNGYLPVDMKADFWEVGSKIEIVKNLNFLMGIKSLTVKGNEVFANIDTFNRIDNFSPYSFDFQEFLLGTGFQCHFTNHCFLMVSGYFSKKETSNSINSFTINQFYSNFSYQF